MTPSDFVHLHVHTQYSLLDGANMLDPLLQKAKDYKMKALAITDHGTLFGAIDFYTKAKEYDIAPIIGCEMYVASGSRLDRGGAGDTFEGTNHLILLAMDLDGYKNLLKLSSLAHLEGFYYKPRVDREVLSQYNKGLVATSACLNGIISKSIREGDISRAKTLAGEYADIFKDRFYLEVQSNGLPEQDKVNAGLLEVRKALGLPLVATNDCHYMLREHARAHDVLLCIQTGKTRQDQDRLRFATEELYFKSPMEMAALFKDIPEAVKNTREIADRCTLDLKSEKVHIPHFPIPDGETADSYLEKLALSGLEDRLEAILQHTTERPADVEERYSKRLTEELRTIKTMGFSGYFLIVSDVIRYARSRNIPVGPGRGSAAGSLTSYALKITNIDPIPYSLLFERFLNPDRKSLPDIDMDFCEIKRDEVFQYVENKYGADRVAHIATFGTLKPRAVIRDVGRVMGIPYGDVDKIAKLIPAGAKDIDDALKGEPRLKELQKSDHRVAELMEIARSLQGLNRHASTHAAGVVISDTPLVEHLPLSRDADGHTVTQYDMKSVAKIGLVKFDFLGLKTLTVLDRAKKYIHDSKGISIQFEDIPLDDPDTYALLCSGQTKGVFQLESRGMTDLVLRLKPGRFEDLIALVALYRPGPMMMMDDFIKRKQGKIPVTYEVPALENILKDTCGIMLYQEQVMQIFHTIGGFSMAEADLIRRAMGKKEMQVMKVQRKKFVAGAMERGIPKAVAEGIFEHMERFAEYGFNKSHSAAYAMVSFHTAYLKAHYTVEFMAALLSSESGDSDNVMKYIQECRDLGIKILPPDINESDRDFTVVGGRDIRFGLGAVKNVGDAAVDAIILARKNEGRLPSIFDLCARVDARRINKKVLESLIKCGACDSMGAKRSQLMAVLGDVMDRAAADRKGRENGQMSIFHEPESSRTNDEAPAMEEWPDAQLLAFEKESIGFYLTSHPLKQFENELKHYGTADTLSIHDLPDGTEVCVGGIPAALREITTRKGDRMGFLTLEDLKGHVEVVVFPEVFRKSSLLLREEGPIFVKGRTDKGEEESKLLASEILTFSEARKNFIRNVHITMTSSPSSREDLEKLKQILSRHHGQCRTFLHLITPETGETVISLPQDYWLDVDDVLVKKVEDLLGPGSITPLSFRPEGGNMKRSDNDAQV